jgi:hypothetical protein
VYNHGRYRCHKGKAAWLGWVCQGANYVGSGEYIPEYRTGKASAFKRPESRLQARGRPSKASLSGKEGDDQQGGVSGDPEPEVEESRGSGDNNDIQQKQGDADQSKTDKKRKTPTKSKKTRSSRPGPAHRKQRAPKKSTTPKSGRTRKPSGSPPYSESKDDRNLAKSRAHTSSKARKVGPDSLSTFECS